MKPVTPADVSQVGGRHYKVQDSAYEHWNWAWYNKLDFFQYQITKYVVRHRDKHGLEDLRKASHFLLKYIELLEKDGTPVIDAQDVTIPSGTQMVSPMVVKPDGWIGFVYEGTDGKGALFTCRVCRNTVRCPHEHYPGHWHMKCPGDRFAEPDRNYVDQDNTIPAGMDDPEARKRAAKRAAKAFREGMQMSNSTDAPFKSGV
jgi:hypothetical protein